MPSTTRRQQRMMAADYARASKGQKTTTGMTLGQLADFRHLKLKRKKGKKRA